MKFKPLLFGEFLKAVLEVEGGNSSDQGGTSRGVTQETWDRWCRQHHQSPSKVSTASDNDIASLYFTEYFVPLRLGMMRADWGLLLGVQAINLPYGMAVRVVQSILMRLGGYHGQIDGVVAGVTIEATTQVDEETTVHGLDGMAAYYGTRDEPFDMPGYMKRLQDIAIAISKLPVEGE